MPASESSRADCYGSERLVESLRTAKKSHLAGHADNTATAPFSKRRRCAFRSGRYRRKVAAESHPLPFGYRPENSTAGVFFAECNSCFAVENPAGGKILNVSVVSLLGVRRLEGERATVPERLMIVPEKGHGTECVDVARPPDRVRQERRWAFLSSLEAGGEGGARHPFRNPTVHC